MSLDEVLGQSELFPDGPDLVLVEIFQRFYDTTLFSNKNEGRGLKIRRSEEIEKNLAIIVMLELSKCSKSKPKTQMGNLK